MNQKSKSPSVSPTPGLFQYPNPYQYLLDPLPQSQLSNRRRYQHSNTFLLWWTKGWFLWEVAWVIVNAIERDKGSTLFHLAFAGVALALGILAKVAHRKESRYYRTYPHLHELASEIDGYQGVYDRTLSMQQTYPCSECGTDVPWGKLHKFKEPGKTGVKLGIEVVTIYCDKCCPRCVYKKG